MGFNIKILRNKGKACLYTTGAIEQFKMLNIYDLAGNIWSVRWKILAMQVLLADQEVVIFVIWMEQIPQQVHEIYMEKRGMQLLTAIMVLVSE